MTSNENLIDFNKFQIEALQKRIKELELELHYEKLKNIEHN